MDQFWLLLFAFVAPVLRLLPWVLLAALIFLAFRIPRIRLARRRRRLIRHLEQKRGSNVIVMIHRGGGPLSLFGGGGAIGGVESEAMLKVLRELPGDKPIDLVLHTPGGSVLHTTQIARALKNHPAPVRVIVPHRAMSGGTFLSLAADEIIMDPNATLGPIDPQTFNLKGKVPMASVLRVAREKSKDEIEDETWVLIDQAEKAIRQIEDHLTGLLADRLGEERARALGRTMTEGRWTHDFPLTWEALRDMGLTISTDVPPEAYELLHLFPEGARFSPVQWLPGKRKPTEEPES